MSEGRPIKPETFFFPSTYQAASPSSCLFLRSGLRSYARFPGRRNVHAEGEALADTSSFGLFPGASLGVQGMVFNLDVPRPQLTWFVLSVWSKFRFAIRTKP
ncbi:hypothetical protein RRG08_029751 [Elysia crispata]|uniref:Uncharacterized protein n=1 Tax=Elysia crispata TaxID=231223 RepID=A0AAE1B603_9GAST|nr:hypothetical protein RRG08_029751 [Elysia crispata]